MAGRGSRLRPHSLTVPKPMLPVAGSPIVAQLVLENKEVKLVPAYFRSHSQIHA